MNFERSPFFIPWEPRKVLRSRSASFETLRFQRVVSSFVFAMGDLNAYADRHLYTHHRPESAPEGKGIRRPSFVRNNTGKSTAAPVFPGKLDRERPPARGAPSPHPAGADAEDRKFHAVSCLYGNPPFGLRAGLSRYLRPDGARGRRARAKTSRRPRSSRDARISLRESRAISGSRIFAGAPFVSAKARGRKRRG